MPDGISVMMRFGRHQKIQTACYIQGRLKRFNYFVKLE